MMVARKRERFSLPSASAGCGFGKRTLAEARGYDAVAPEAAARVSPIGGVASTRDGRSVWAISV
jgi:hypothetical protein